MAAPSVLRRGLLPLHLTFIYGTDAGGTFGRDGAGRAMGPCAPGEVKTNHRVYADNGGGGLRCANRWGHRAAHASVHRAWEHARVNTTTLVHTIGYAGIFAILFAETGLLIGFFLPGDTLLISAGILASRGQLSLPILLIGGSIAAVAGDAVGYTIGREAGPRLFQRDDSFWFRRKHLETAQRFFERHGGKTIFIARYIVAVRTLAPVVAGAAKMPYPRFALFNITGGISWVCVVTLLSYAFGSVVSTLDNYIFIATLIILPIPALIAIVQYIRLRRAQKRAGAQPAAGRGDHPAGRP